MVKLWDVSIILGPPAMDIYLARGEERNGPYSMDSIRQFLADGELDGTELAWHEGLDEWVNLWECLKSLRALDEETLSQVNKIKELISDGHADTAWQLIQSLNNPSIYEGLLEDCLADEGEWVSAPEYLSKDGEFFIRLLGKLPEDKLTQLTSLDLEGNQITDLTPLKDLTQLTDLNLLNNQITDLTPPKDLTQLTMLNLMGNQITDLTPLKDLTQLTRLWLSGNPDLTKAQIAELKKALPKCRIFSNPTK